MDESEFEGTLVLEKLAALGKLDEFFNAIDADNLAAAKSLMRRAGVDAESIAIVMRMVNDGEE